MFHFHPRRSCPTLSVNRSRALFHPRRGRAVILVAHRIQTIESALTSSAKVAGSLEATSYNADEEGESKIRAYNVKNFLGLNHIFDDDEAPVLAIDPDKIQKIQSGATKTVGKKKLRLKRGITMDTGAHHNVMPKRMAWKRKIRASPGSRRVMCYVAAGNERMHNEA